MKTYGKFSLFLAAILTAATATAQSSIAVEEQFADLTQSLSGTADRLLKASSAQPGSASTQFPGQFAISQKQEPAASSFGNARWRELRTQVEPILKAQGLPIEVLAVVKVESGGQSDALSRAGARGLWQLMPDTARRYGLIVSESRDERIDPEKATWAATQYLRDLYAMFGDWRLALAAYNAGEDAISRAISRAGSREFDVLSLKRAIPEETRKYVPAVMAAMRKIGDPKVLAGLTEVVRRDTSQVYASMDVGD